MDSLIEQYMEQEHMHHTEGRRGVENLCKLSRAIGYKDPMNYGQLTNGSSIGDLIAFLEDNSGAVEAVINWIGNQRSPEWKEALKSQLEIEQPADDDDDQ